ACYLDEARTDKESAITTVGGYVAACPDWLQFEVAADGICADANVSVIHGVDFHHGRRSFKGWNSHDKELFAEKLQAALKPIAILGVTQSAVNADFAKVKKEYKVVQQESVYGWCFRRIVGIALDDPIIRVCFNETSNVDIHFILEEGCKNRPDVERIWDEIKRISPMRGRLSALTFAPKESTRAVQMADFLAYHSRRYLGKYDVERGPEAPEPKIISILRDGIHIEDGVSYGFKPRNKNAKKRV
ncbi:MAG: DUF3800 domain-containing protein, partial [Stellaceae bacterium]